MTLSATSRESLRKAFAGPNSISDGDAVHNMLNTATATSGGAWTIPAGLTVTAGGITVTAGGQTITSGSLTLTSGNLTLTSGNATLTSGSLTLTSGNVVLTSGNLTFTAASDINVPANTAAALEVYDATTKIVAVDTRNTLKDINSVTFTGVPVTVATEAAAHLNSTVRIAAKTITYTGTNTVTSSLGAQLWIGAPTFTDASAGTLSLASSVHVIAVAAAGGSLTLTAARMISTSVSDCYLTNAGVWTDTACWESGKSQVNRTYENSKEAVNSVLDKIVPATWQYKSVTELPGIDEHGNECVHQTAINDRGRNRVGIVYDDLPEELRAPGEERAVAPSVLASFSLAAIKHLRDENRTLAKRLEALEAK